jgi:hypothetical protein
VCALQYVKDLYYCIDKLFPVNSPALVCDDFNFSSIDWSLDNRLSTGHSITVHYVATQFVLESSRSRFYYNHGLCQCVNAPTRYNNILDLILTNDINCVLNAGPVEPFSTILIIHEFVKDYRRLTWVLMKILVHFVVTPIRSYKL